MRFPGDDKRREARDIIVTEDASRLADEAGPLLDRALGVEWYLQYGSDVDRAALTLCRLRRAKAAQLGAPQHGDDAVRLALAEASTTALVWLASRAISYMDENGFPEAVAPWFADS